MIISKHLYAQIIQIGMSSRAIVLEKETSKLMWEKFQSLFVESLYVITNLLTNSGDETVFFEVINDKAVIELLAYCLTEQTKLNLPDKLVYLALLSLEIALNFSYFNNEEDSINILDFKVKEYL